MFDVIALISFLISKFRLGYISDTLCKYNGHLLTFFCLEFFLTFSLHFALTIPVSKDK